jgi:hypothetical protein
MQKHTRTNINHLSPTRKGIAYKTRFLTGCLLSLLSIALIGGGFVSIGMLRSRYPAAINMGSCSKNMAGMQMDIGDMHMSGSNGGVMSLPRGACTDVTSLQAPLTAAHVDTFTLTAQSAHLSLGSGASIDAWTFNGTSPGPTLRVRQGDLVVVHLVNHLSFGGPSTGMASRFRTPLMERLESPRTLSNRARAIPTDLSPRIPELTGITRTRKVSSRLHRASMAC